MRATAPQVEPVNLYACIGARPIDGYLRDHDICCGALFIYCRRMPDERDRLSGTLGDAGQFIAVEAMPLENVGRIALVAVCPQPLFKAVIGSLDTGYGEIVVVRP